MDYLKSVFLIAINSSICMTLLCVGAFLFLLFYAFLNLCEGDKESFVVFGSFSLVSLFLVGMLYSPTLDNLSEMYVNGKIDKATLEKVLPYAIDREVVEEDAIKTKHQRRKEFNELVDKAKGAK